MQILTINPRLSNRRVFYENDILKRNQTILGQPETLSEMEIATQHYKSGCLQQAAKIYQQVLKRDPDHAEAHSLEAEYRQLCHECCTQIRDSRYKNKGAG